MLYIWHPLCWEFLHMPKVHRKMKFILSRSLRLFILNPHSIHHTEQRHVNVEFRVPRMVITMSQEEVLFLPITLPTRRNDVTKAGRATGAIPSGTRYNVFHFQNHVSPAFSPLNTAVLTGVVVSLKYVLPGVVNLPVGLSNLPSVTNNSRNEVLFALSVFKAVVVVLNYLGRGADADAIAPTASFAPHHPFTLTIDTFGILVNPLKGFNPRNHVNRHHVGV